MLILTELRDTPDGIEREELRRWLMETIGVSRQAVHKALSELVDAGCVTQVTLDDGTRHIGGANPSVN